MADGSLERATDLLARMLSLPAEDRPAFLDRECEGDTDLRDLVTELADLDDDAAAYFDELTDDIVAVADLEIDSAARPARHVGPYVILESIGHGGMGAVFRARRVDGAFDHEVALKLLHLDMETPQMRARFIAERQLLAHLQHPNIATLFDGGVTDEGRPFFAMELIDGQPVTIHCAEQQLPMEKVLGLMLDVIEAVSYLHRNLVVHRDLKPSNILVDRDGRVKLLDFGIAKLLSEEPEGGGFTRTGEVLMTPSYAAPEQRLGRPVTTAADVYSLGIVLYELLTGQRPTGTGAPAAPVDDELPNRPNSILGRQDPSSADTDPHAHPVVPWRRIDRDLETICLTALHPDPALRYPSAEQFGQDIERFRQGLPISARPSTFGYRLGKLARRHRTALIVAVGVLALLAAGMVREHGLRRSAELAKSEAQLQAARAVAVTDFLRDLLASANPMRAQGRDLTVAEVLEQASERLDTDTELASQPELEAAIRQTLGSTLTSLGRYETALPHLERAVDLRGGFDAREPEALSAQAELAIVSQHLGRKEVTESILKRVLEVRITDLGEEHPLVLTTMNQLADLYWSLGRFEDVETLDRKTLEIRRRVLDADHPDILKSLNGLATTLFTRARYAGAAERFDEALTVARRTLGSSHPHTITLANNLAAAHLELGRNREAADLLRDVVEARRRVLGDAHHETAMSIHNLGAALARLGEYAEAEERFLEAIAIREQLPTGRKNVLFSQSYLADTYRDAGRFEDAEALYVSTIDRQRDALGADHGDTLKTIAGFAMLRARQGDFETAVGMLEELLSTLEAQRGEGHPDTIGNLTALAEIRRLQGRPNEALSLIRRAVDTGTASLGADHPAVAEAIQEARRIEEALGQDTAATGDDSSS
jgi:serine/threonine protein kinase/Flp pilus assembly protein TadD